MSLSTCLPILSLAFFASCGGSSLLSPQPTRPDLHRGEVPVRDLLAELDSLSAPREISTAEFAALKASLRSFLTNHPTDRIAAKAPTGGANVVHDLTADTDLDAADVQTDLISWTYTNTGDYDQNGECNINDLTALGINLNKNTSSPDWLTKGRFADGDHNGEVNISDITPLGQNLLNQVQAYRVETAETEAGPWTEFTTVDFSTSAAQPSGAVMFRVPVSTPPAPVYRVVPLDAASTAGVPSDPSKSFVLSEKAEIVGQAGGVQFVSRNGFTVILQAPNTDPTTIAVGDVLVGDDGADGYLWTVATVDQVGDQITVTGTPAALSDLIVKGVVDMAKLFNPDPPAAASQKAGSVVKRTSAPEPLVLDCTQQTMSLPEGSTFKVNHMLFSFAPDVTLRITIDAKADPDNPVKSFIMKIDTAQMECDFDVALENAAQTGAFPATPYDPMYEHSMGDFDFQFDELQNEVPFSATWTFNIHVGIAGSGDFQGTYPLLANSHYDNAVFGATWKPASGWTDYNTYTSAYTDPDPANPPAFDSTATSPAALRWYVRGEVSAELFGDASRVTKLYFEPTAQLITTPTSTPSNGDDYQLDGWLHLERDFGLGLYGQQDMNYASTHDENHIAIESGFKPRTTDRSISGRVSDAGGNGVSGLLVSGYPTGSPPSTLWGAITDTNGDYTLTGISPGMNVTVQPDISATTTYVFTPPTRDYPNITTNQTGADFTATPPAGWTHTLGFSGFDDTVSAVAVDNAGNTYVVGSTTNNAIGETDPLIVKYDPNGVRLWSRQEFISFTGGGAFNAVAVDASGIYTVGTYDSVSTLQQDILIMKWDDQGNAVWKQSWGLSSPSQGWGIGLDSSSNVYVAGECNQGLISGQEAVVLKLNPAGVVQWEKVYQGPNTDFVRGAWYDQANDAFLVTGHAANTTGSLTEDVSLLKIQPDGTLILDKLYDIANQVDAGLGIMTDPSGMIYICGNTVNGAGTLSQAAVLRIQSGGTIAPSMTWAINDPNATFHGFNGLTFDGSGNVITAGYWKDNSVPRLNAAVVKWDFLLAHQSTEIWTGASADTRLYGAAWSALDGKLMLGGYAPNTTGGWTVAAPPTVNNPVVGEPFYLGTWASVTGTVNPDSPNPSDSFPATDVGDGGRDAFTQKRDGL